MPTPVPTPRTRFIRPFTTHILNRFTRLFVHRLPGFAIISHRGRKSGQTTIHLTDPELFVDPTRRLMPQHVRTLLGVMRVSEFLRMRPAKGLGL